MNELTNGSLHLQSASKGSTRTQFGALCWRVRKGKLQFCMITTRRTGRWVIPKGWPVENATPSESAAIEAMEEAGVSGKIDDRSLGIFTYLKELDGDDMPCAVAVFPLKVRDVAKTWKEKDQRSRRWVSRKAAARMVQEPELARIILSFDPRRRIP